MCHNVCRSPRNTSSDRLSSLRSAPAASAREPASVAKESSSIHRVKSSRSAARQQDSRNRCVMAPCVARAVWGAHHARIVPGLAGVGRLRWQRWSRPDGGRCSASSSSRSPCSPDSPSLFATCFNRKSQAPGMDVDRWYRDWSRRPPKRIARGSYREACRTAWSLAARAWAFCFRSA